MPVDYGYAGGPPLSMTPPAPVPSTTPVTAPLTSAQYTALLAQGTAQQTQAMQPQISYAPSVGDAITPALQSTGGFPMSPVLLAGLAIAAAVLLHGNKRGSS
jgi:hypothetical protein